MKILEKHKIQSKQVVLVSGRYAKQKNIPSLLRFLKSLKYKNVYLFAGKDINQNNKELFKIIKKLDIKNVMLLNEKKIS